MPREFTDEDKEHLKLIFDECDENKSGHLEPEEIKHLMCCLGDNPTEAQIQECMDSCDGDADGKISYDDLEKMMTELRDRVAEDPRAELSEAFQMLDTDGSGYLDRAELSEVLKTLGDTPMSDEDLEEMFTNFDTDGDGKIKYEEYVNYMCGDEGKGQGQQGEDQGQQGGDEI